MQQTHGQPDYSGLLKAADPGQRGPKRKFNKRITHLRTQEVNRRESAVKWRVFRALSKLYPEVVEQLRAQAQAIVAAEKGPLPGDPGWTDPDD